MNAETVVLENLTYKHEQEQEKLKKKRRLEELINLKVETAKQNYSANQNYSPKTEFSSSEIKKR